MVLCLLCMHIYIAMDGSCCWLSSTYLRWPPLSEEEGAGPYSRCLQIGNNMEEEEIRTRHCTACRPLPPPLVVAPACLEEAILDPPMRLHLAYVGAMG